MSRLTEFLKTIESDIEIRNRKIAAAIEYAAKRAALTLKPIKMNRVEIKLQVAFIAEQEYTGSGMGIQCEFQRNPCSQSILLFSKICGSQGKVNVLCTIGDVLHHNCCRTFISPASAAGLKFPGTET